MLLEAGHGGDKAARQPWYLLQIEVQQTGSAPSRAGSYLIPVVQLIKFIIKLAFAFIGRCSTSKVEQSVDLYDNGALDH